MPSFSLDSLRLACEFKLPISQVTWELTPWVSLGFDIGLLHFYSFLLAANLKPSLREGWAKFSHEWNSFMVVVKN